MPIPCDIRELESKKFVECPTGQPSVSVKICNPEDIVVGGGPTLTLEQQNGNLSSAGDTVTITASSGNIRSFFVQNPSEGPRQNAGNKVLELSLDGGTTYWTIQIGQFGLEDIDIASFILRSDKNNTNYEIILEHD